MQHGKVILIAGPTASGKSALALRLAAERGGIIINADSMQVYRQLRILSARPTAEDEACVPHRLYGHVPAAEAYSAGRYAIEAAQAIAEARTLERIAVLVGGTGLYFKTLIEGLSPIPAIPAEVRQRWRREVEHSGAGELHKVLAGRDPEMARRLRPSDAQRVVRALEVLEATGRSLARWQEEPGTPIIDLATAERLVVEADRDLLYRRCDARFDRMMEAGALDEVRALAGLGLPGGLPAMRALAVRPLVQHLAGKVSLEEAVAAAKRETRQYVKRQMVWLRRNMNTWKPIRT